jgi:arginine repressor
MKQIRKQIDICKKRNSQNKKRNNIDVTDEVVCKYLRSLGIFCVDKRDIRSVMKMMKNRKKIEGVSGSFLQIFTYLFTRRDKYQKYIVLKIA